MPSWGPDFVNKLIFILFLYLYNKHRLFVNQLYIKETDKEQLTHDGQGIHTIFILINHRNTLV
jgi:hypothetical protein